MKSLVLHTVAYMIMSLTYLDKAWSHWFLHDILDLHSILLASGYVILFMENWVHRQKNKENK